MGKTVLIVEDDEKYRKILSAKLKSSGFEIETAINGVDALNKLKVNDVSLIVLDLLMPGMSGWNFMYELAKSSYKNIPIIILTNLSESSYPSQVPIIYDFMVKSNVSLDEVVEKVKKRIH
jgi:DNA-binding response OmpR family regulator